MADIRCSHCGNNNPDFFDVCQFCQSPLKSESMLHAGDIPQEMDTGELEPILPDWLQDVRQQSRDVAADDPLHSQTKSKIQKNAAPDLLAGLAAQTDSDEDEVPDWLASINPVVEKKPSMSPSKADEKPSDFISQFERQESQPPTPPAPSQMEKQTPDWMSELESRPSAQKDELTDWFSQSPAETGTTFPVESDEPVNDNTWMNNLGSLVETQPEPPAQQPPEDLGWLHDLETSSKQTDDLSSARPDLTFGFASAQPDSSQDDLGWLNNLGGTPAPSFEEPAPTQAPSSKDDLSWLNNFGGTPAPSFEEPAPTQKPSSQEDLSWLNTLGGTPVPSFEEPAPTQAPSSQEDLSWLNKFGETSAPSIEEPAPTQAPSLQEDLSWLNNFGDTSAPSFEEPAPTQIPSSQEDLSWSNALGETSVPSFEEPVATQEPSSQEDLSWLSALGETPAPSFEETPTLIPSSQEDLSWLNTLGGTTALALEEPAPTPTQPSAAASDQPSDLEWLQNLEGQQDISVPADMPTQYTPSRTAPLNADALDTTPDWLKKAIEEPSMPPLGAVSMAWFAEQAKTKDAEPAGPNQDQPASVEPGFDFAVSESSISSMKDMDSLFKDDMPDWLERESQSDDAFQSESVTSPALTDDSLAPVELPSWVQAMRPVDSAIEAPSTTAAEQSTEQEGPLAGFQGIIPIAAVGSALRPKAFSQKLQVTEDHQEGASLIEQIILTESVAQPSKKTGHIVSQQKLRWLLAGLFLVVLSLVIGLNLRIMPIYASASVNELSNLIATIPDSSPVLVVVDYEPSLAGELEAAAGPMLDQLALSRHSIFTYLSMSPNGVGMVDRMMFNTNISKPKPEGLGYQLGEQYFNTGFLPGGSAGVLGFIEDPMKVMPRVDVADFSKFKAVIIITDNAESGRVWVEQLAYAKATNPALFNQPLLMVSSAQSGPMYYPYVSSGHVDIMINGLYDGAQYEYVNNTRPGLARSYWDAFGVGLMMAILAIVVGSIWNVVMGNRERRAEEQG